MKAAKFLERPQVIRLFGGGLFVAPFINIGINIFLQSQKHHVTFGILWKSLTVGTLSQNLQNLLSVASISIGLLMLVGVRQAWSWVLGLLGLQIVIQTMTLMKDVKESWIWGGVFSVNLVIFFYIADQLVFKEKRSEERRQNPLPKTVSQEPLPQGPPSPEPLPQSAEILTTRKRIFIHFLDLQMWGQLTHISKEGLRVRPVEGGGGLPPLNDRQMEVFLRKNLRLKLRLRSHSPTETYFEFLPMTFEEIQALNVWILEKAEVKRGSSIGDFNSLSFAKKVS